MCLSVKSSTRLKLIHWKIAVFKKWFPCTIKLDQDIPFSTFSLNLNQPSRTNKYKAIIFLTLHRLFFLHRYRQRTQSCTHHYSLNFKMNSLENKASLQSNQYQSNQYQSNQYQSNQYQSNQYDSNLFKINSLWQQVKHSITKT